MTKSEELITAGEIVEAALIPGTSWPDANRYAWMLMTLKVAICIVSSSAGRTGSASATPGYRSSAIAPMVRREVVDILGSDTTPIAHRHERGRLLSASRTPSKSSAS